MTEKRVRRASLLLLAAVLLSACSTTSDAPTPPPSPAPAPAPTPTQEALLAYERYWSVTTAAFNAPNAKDWSTDLQAVASGPALAGIAEEVRNYATFPAHTEGTISRSPTLGEVTNDRVEIIDCVDLGDSRLIADTTGETLDDLKNQVPRFRFRAELARQNGRWLVHRTEPALGEPC
jgi:hypothetical protein